MDSYEINKFFNKRAEHGDKALVVKFQGAPLLENLELINRILFQHGLCSTSRNHHLSDPLHFLTLSGAGFCELPVPTNQPRHR